jgi:putative component of membrane protein insertase Oxa1/YidC/SpoIIIJ protein YidD
MNVSSFEILTQRTALWSIDAYQKYISPRKGFACPHRLLHGGLSCSDYVKELLTHQNLTSAIQSSTRRFRDCALASKALKSEKREGGCIVIPCCIPL